MKLFNKGQRAFLISRSLMKSGDARPVKDENGGHLATFAAQTVADIEDKEASRLLKMYPKELMKWYGEPEKVKKAPKKVKKGDNDGMDGTASK